jgi:hypothetical protein
MPAHGPLLPPLSPQTTKEQHSTQEPTQAELDPNMQALVVSEETVAGGAAINAGRATRGFTPLVIIVVPVIGYQCGAGSAEQGSAAATDVAAGQQVVGSVASGGGKLSSTQLRAHDAAALGTARQ